MSYESHLKSANDIMNHDNTVGDFLNDWDYLGDTISIKITPKTKRREDESTNQKTD
jgi:hypothetical protein